LDDEIEHYSQRQDEAFKQSVSFDPLTAEEKDERSWRGVKRTRKAASNHRRLVSTMNKIMSWPALLDRFVIATLRGEPPAL
jgi:hypothetical protein